MFALVLATMLWNPSITELDRELFSNTEEVCIESFEPDRVFPEDEAFSDYVIKCTRRGDNNGLTADDMYWLYQCVGAENGNDYEAAYLTACCILNRLRVHWNGANTIEEVVFQKGQFAVVSNRRIYSNKYVTPDVIKAVNEAVDHNKRTDIFFFSYGHIHHFANVVAKVGNEYFYGEGK